MKKNFNKKIIKSSIVNINNTEYDLGKLYSSTQSYCAVTKKYLYSFKCLNTGKSFNDNNKLTEHLVNYLISSKKVILID